MTHKFISRDRSGVNLSPGSCWCGKRSYPTKADAKRSASQQRDNGKLRPYRHGDVWHLTSQDYATKLRYRQADR